MRFNFRFLSDLIVVSIILTGLTYYAHKYQVRRSGPLMLKLAREARDTGNIGRAAQLYMQYLKVEPDSSAATTEFGALAASSGNVEGTYYQLSKSLRLDPSQSEIREQLAEIAVESGRYADAKQVLSGETNSELRSRPRRVWMQGVAEQHLGETSLAREYFESAVEAVPHEPEYARSLAELLAEEFSDTKRGEQVLNRLIDEAPENATAHLVRGRWLLQRAANVTDAELSANRLDAAWEDVLQANRLEPENPESAILAADVANAKGTPEQAREMVEKSIAANPKRPALYRAIAEIETAAGHRDLAIERLQQGLVEIPDDTELLWDLALQQFETGNTESIDDIFQQLRSQEFAEGRIRLLEARMLAEDGQYYEAIDLLEKFDLMFDPVEGLSMQADELLAHCFRKLGDSDQQLAALRRVIVVDPLGISARESLAETLLELGNLREAMSEYGLIIDRPNPSVEARINHARVLLLEGLGKPANNWHWTQLQSILPALEAIPEAATDAAVLRAELLAAQGQREEAVALLKSKIESDTETLRASRTLLELLIEAKDWEQVESTLQLAEQANGDSPTLRLERGRYLIKRYGEQATEQPQWDPLLEPASDWDEPRRAELVFGFAPLLLKIEDYPACEQLARRVAESETSQPRLDFFLLLFDLALQSGNTETMNAALARVQPFGQAEPLLRIGKGVELMIEAEALPESDTARRDSLYEQAITKLNEASIERPAWPQIPRLKGEIYDSWGRPDQVVQNYLDAISLGDQDAELIARTALHLFEQERHAETDKIIRKLQERNVTLSPELMRIGAKTALELEDYDRARSLAQSSAEQSDEVEDHLLLAEICRLSEDLATAQQEYQTAVDIEPTRPESWVSLIEVLAEQSKFDQARTVLDEARQALPAEGSDDALAQCFAAIHDYPKAEEHYRKALQTQPESLPLIRRVAEFYLSIDKSSEAEPLLQQLVEAEPEESEQPDRDWEEGEDDRSWSRRNLALIYGLQPGAENLRRAESLINANASQNKTLPQDQRVLAIIYGNRQDKRSRDKAIALLQQVINQQSKFSLNDHFLLAEFYNRIGDSNNYHRTMSTLLDKGGDQNPTCIAYHASVLVEEGKLAEAQPWIRQLIKLAPQAKTSYAVVFDWLFHSQDHGRLLGLLESKAEDQANGQWVAELAEKFGTTLTRQGATEKAEPFLALAAKLFTQISEAESGNPLILTAYQARQGAFDQVLETLSDPDLDPNTLAGISRMALQSGKLSDEQGQQLIALTSEALQRNPDNEALGLCVADLHGWLGNWDEATEAFKALLTAQPSSVSALNNMAAILALSGQRLDVASRAIDKAINILGPTDVLYDTRGMVRLAAGRPQLAEQDFREAIEVQARVDRLFHLAQALHAQGKTDDARATFKQAQEDGLTKQRLHRQEWRAFEQLASEL